MDLCVVGMLPQYPCCGEGGGGGDAHVCACVLV